MALDILDKTPEWKKVEKLPQGEVPAIPQIYHRGQHVPGASAHSALLPLPLSANFKMTPPRGRAALVWPWGPQRLSSKLSYGRTQEETCELPWPSGTDCAPKGPSAPLSAPLVLRSLPPGPVPSVVRTAIFLQSSRWTGPCSGSPASSWASRSRPSRWVGTCGGEHGVGGGPLPPIPAPSCLPPAAPGRRGSGK